MSGDDLRSQYFWHAPLIPMLCVIAFVIAAMIVIVVGYS